MNYLSAQSSRRTFLARSSMGLAALSLVSRAPLFAADAAAILPVGSAPAPLDAAWFPSRLHTFIWRNWALVPALRLAEVVGATPADIGAMGHSMGLEPPRGLRDADRRRAHLTIIRRNWHLLPYDQICKLLGWPAERLAHTLREDDFFFIKLGSLKPAAQPLRWVPPTPEQAARAAEIAAIVREHFPNGGTEGSESLFAFIDHLSAPLPTAIKPAERTRETPLRMGYSYFALSGDPLLDPTLDPYPDGLLARLAVAGENAVWLHVELAHLAPVPWRQESGIDRRLVTLRDLVARAGRHGIEVFLYLNEPRSLPTTSPVFDRHPEWRGVREGDSNAICTSAPGVRDAIRDAIAGICRAVPDLGGFFTITSSENLTNCWSHGTAAGCPRCEKRPPAEVIAEVSAIIVDGIRAAGGQQRYIAWDWGWKDEWALEAIALLPPEIGFMSVSEWALPIERGGVKSTVGEYSISSIGPGPRALRHWQAARKRGLRVVAKIQCGNTWEISAIPYLPVLENITRHATALHKAGVRDIMLGWTLGGHPSPNIEAISEIESGGTLDTLARKRHGESHAAAAAFWRECSAAFRQFPYHIGCVYQAPLQMGPANPLWPAPTGYTACMVGIPYDDLTSWRAIYPAETFISQLQLVAAGFEAAIATLRAAVPNPQPALAEELMFAEAAAIHFASVANQSRAVVARDAGDHSALREICHAEARLALRLHALQSRDSRIGFESSNQYYYTPHDLVEKVINCKWLAAQTKVQPRDSVQPSR